MAPAYEPLPSFTILIRRYTEEKFLWFWTWMKPTDVMWVVMTNTTLDELHDQIRKEFSISHLDRVTLLRLDGTPIVEKDDLKDKELYVVRIN